MEFRPGLIERPGAADGPQAFEGLDAGRFEPLLQEINAGTVDSQMSRAYQQVDPAFAAMMKERHQRQFFKTKICKFWESNQCQRGSSCVYAHGEHELCAAPNLEKTALCFKVLKGGTCSNPECKFAHSVVELRASVTKAPLSRMTRPGAGRTGRDLGGEAPGRSEWQDNEDTFDEGDKFSDDLGEPPWPRMASCPDAFQSASSASGFWRQQSAPAPHPARYVGPSSSHYDEQSASQDPISPGGRHVSMQKADSHFNRDHSFGRQVSAPAGLSLEAALFGDQASEPPKRKSPTMTLSSPYVSRDASLLQPELQASIAAELTKGNFTKAKEQMLQMELLRLAPWSNSRASTRAPNSRSQGSTDGSGSDQNQSYGTLIDAARMVNTVSNHSNDSITGLGDQDPLSPSSHTQRQSPARSAFGRQGPAPTDLNLEAGLFGQQPFDPANSRSPPMTHMSSTGSGKFQPQKPTSTAAERSKDRLISQAKEQLTQMEMMRRMPWSSTRSELPRPDPSRSASSRAPGQPPNTTLVDAGMLASSDVAPVLPQRDGLDDLDDGPAPTRLQQRPPNNSFNVQAGLAGMLVGGGMQVYQVMPAMAVLTTPGEADASPSAQFLARELQRAMPECYED